MEKNHSNSISPQQPGQVKSLVKAIQILYCFSETEAELSLTDISKKVGIPKSTTLNILRTLEEYGFLSRAYPSMNYKLGYSIMEMNYRMQMSMPAVRLALPFMENLREKTGRTIYLTTHINGKVLYLDVAHQNRQMYSYSINGKTLPMHCTGCGKAMLAYLPDERIRQIIVEHGLPRSTPNTITDESRLFNEIEAIRRWGYAFDHEEESLGVSCISAPILNSYGYPTAALSISGATYSMQQEQLLSFADSLLNTCHALSSNANDFPAGQIFLMHRRQGN